MNIVNSVEEAYQLLAQDVLRFVGDRRWDKACGRYGVLPSMVSSEWWCEINGIRDLGEGGDFSLEESRAKSAAVRFLRDDLLKTTAQRIWGLTFTLYPTGKFRIEYDYNQPEGYAETAETISLDAASESLQRLVADDNAQERGSGVASDDHQGKKKP